MASSVIHLCIANEINKVIKHNKESILIGSIAPDISKSLGQSKLKSHFLDDIDNDIPNIKKFLNKYKQKLNDDFVLGYYIHLYTDYLWFKYFIPEITNEIVITKLDGTKIEYNKELFIKCIYNDYSNLNIQLLDTYNLDLKIFYNPCPKFKKIITEIPMDKINLIVNQAGIIIENAKKEKAILFNVKNIKRFIKTSTDLIIANLNELKPDL